MFAWQTISACSIVCCHDKRHPEGLGAVLLCKDNEEWHRLMVEIKDRLEE